MTPVITAPDLATWRTSPQAHRGYLFIDKPAVVLQAEVWEAYGTYAYPLTSFYYHDVISGDYQDVEEGMTVCIGTTPGAYDLGRTVCRGANDATIFVGLTSRGHNDGELDLSDGVYVTIYDDSRLWAKIPWVLGDGSIRKFGGLTYESNVPPPPVAIIYRGLGEAGFVDPDTDVYTVSLTALGSYVVAEGATITDYLWDIKDGTFISGSATTGTMTATFPPGRRWITLTVTDSNGKTAFRRYLVAACTPDGEHRPLTDFTISRSIKRADGQKVTFVIHEDIPAGTYPDGAAVIYWERETYGDTTAPSEYSIGSIGTGEAGQKHLKFVGWHHEDTADLEATAHGIISGVEFTCYDIAAKLDTLPSFPQTVERDASPTSWLQMADLNIDRYLFYLIHWHSTALMVADFVWSGEGDTYPVSILGSPGTTLWKQVDGRAQAIAHLLTCDRWGRLVVRPDPLLLPVSSRTSTVIVDLTDADWKTLNYTVMRPPRVHWLWGSAVIADDTDADSVTEVQAVKCVAPGDAPGQGAAARSQGEQLVIDQTELNLREGHRYAARHNAPYSYIQLDLVWGNDPGIDPAYMEWVTLTTTASAERGLTFSGARFLPVEVQTTYDHENGTKQVRLLLEKETVGLPAKTVFPDPPNPNTGPYIPPTDYYPPSFELPTENQLWLGKDLKTLGFIHSSGVLYRTDTWHVPSVNGGPTWSGVGLTGLGLSGTVLQFVVNAFSYRTGTIGGWIFTTDGIFYLSDAFGTPSVALQHSWGISWDVDNDRVNADASFGVEGWVLAVLNDASSAVKAVYTTDGGQTWQTTAITNSSSAYNGKVPLAWVSSKIPGLARAAGAILSYVGGEVDVRTGQFGWEIQNGYGAWQSGVGFDTAYSTYEGTTHEFLIIKKTLPNPSTITYIAARRGSDVHPNDLAYKTIKFFVDDVKVYEANPSSMMFHQWSGSQTGSEVTIFVQIGAAYEGQYYCRLIGLAITAPDVIDSGYIYESENYGATWTKTNRSLGQSLGGDIDVPYDSNDDEAIMLYGVEDGVNIYDGSVANITPSQTPGTWAPERGRWALESCVVDQNRLLLVANDGDGNSSLFLSINRGQTWAQATAPASGETAVLRGAISGDDPNTIYVWGKGKTIGLSTDFGASIDDRSGNLALTGGEIVGIFGGTS